MPVNLVDLATAGRLAVDWTFSKPTADLKTAVGNFFIVGAAIVGAWQLIHLRITKVIICLVLVALASVFVYFPNLLQSLGQSIVALFLGQ